MKKLHWRLLALSVLLAVGCGPNWYQSIIDFGPEKSPTANQTAPEQPVRPVTESMVTDENAHEMSQRIWDELDQEEFAVQRVSASQPKSK